MAFPKFKVSEEFPMNIVLIHDLMNSPSNPQIYLIQMWWCCVSGLATLRMESMESAETPQQEEMEGITFHKIHLIGQ